MEKQELIQKIENAKLIKVKYDKKWRYPHQGDSQATCSMLQFMFDIEYCSGTLIFIPDEINYGNEGDRNEG